MSTFAERVRSERKANGLTQIGLAKKAGVSQATIADIERGRNQGSTELVGIAKALHVNPGWLKTGGGDKEIGAAPAPVAVQYEPLEEQVIRLLAGMPDYYAEAWLDKVKGHAAMQRAEKRAAQEARQQQEEDRVGAATSSADPPLGRRRTA